MHRLRCNLRHRCLSHRQHRVRRNSKPQPRPPQAPPANEPPPRQTPDEAPTGPPPPLNVKTVPQGGATNSGSDTQDQLFKIVTNVNQVLVPVTVKDESGHLIGGRVSR